MLHNDILALKLTLDFIETLSLIFNLSSEDKTTIIDKIQMINPNANGFDIEIEKPIKIIAEVKGSIPINKGVSFGSAQYRGIKEDLEHLKNGKPKSKINPDGFYKFMILPDTEQVRIATEKLLNSLQKKVEYNDYSFEVLSDIRKQLSVGVIYIVFVKIK